MICEPENCLMKFLRTERWQKYGNTFLSIAV
jgi:hypothetical protein